MRVPRKIYLISAVSLFLLGAGTVLALQPEPREVTIKQASSVKEESEQPKQEIAKVDAAPAQSQTVQPAPIVTKPTSTVPVPRSVVERQAAARQLVIDSNKCASVPESNPGCPNTQADCFVSAIELRYGWNTVSDQFVTDKVGELNQIYAGMCGAYMMLKQKGSSALGFAS